jgi:hypothetical protein
LLPATRRHADRRWCSAGRRTSTCRDGHVSGQNQSVNHTHGKAMTDIETPIPSEATGGTESSHVAAKRGGNKWLAPGLIVLIVVGLMAGTLVGGVGPFAKTPTAWSGVFLTDNEVFFGHVKSTTADDIDLVNVYYVQSSQGGQTGTDQQSPTQLAVLGLVGNQIQCPQDELIINRHAVLDVQELQSKSFVVQRLETLSKNPQTCFQPAAPSAAASPGASPAAAAPAAPAATPLRSPTP